MQVVKKASTMVFQGRNGPQSKTKAVVADDSNIMAVYIMDERIASSMAEGRSYSISKVSMDNGVVRISSSASAYRIGMIPVPAELLAQADNILTGPCIDYKRIEEIKELHPPTRCSFRGRVISDMALRNVQSGGTSTALRDIIVSDDTRELRCTLWRDATNLQTPPGVRVCVKDATLTFNSFHKSVVTSINAPDELEVIQQSKKARITLLGLGATDEDTLTMLASVDSIDMELRVAKRLLLNDKSEDDLIDDLPLAGEGSVDKGELKDFHPDTPL